MATLSEINSAYRDACAKYESAIQGLAYFLRDFDRQIYNRVQIPPGCIRLAPVPPTVTIIEGRGSPEEALEYDSAAGCWRFIIAFAPGIDRWRNAPLARQVQVQLEATCDGEDIRVKIRGQDRAFSRQKEVDQLIDHLTDTVRDVLSGLTLDPSDNTPIRIGF